ncbi:hypothetical protein BX666DRAFT_1650651 [Dichotomocladium elegans]|nr:hypothetical protein BX666DRAFT_1650651 [Dichotomocladium elegans]
MSTDRGGHAASFPSRTMPIQIQRVQRATNAIPVDAEQHQRQLDDQLEKVNFDDITVSELKEMLRQRGKPATGKKVVLVQRLQDERDLIKSIRNGKAQRHSQPPPASSPRQEPTRPRSYQGSSPMTIHAMPRSPLMGDAGANASSMPNSLLTHPGSPNSVTMSLNRSIANMHIGSPPLSAAQHSRRYSPYATPGSPRIMASSPKTQNPPYSSSMPNNHSVLSSSPSNNTNNYGAQLSSSYTNRYRPFNAYGRTKNYAPFTSSALATPDRDDDRDPFDDYTVEQENTSPSSSAISPGRSEAKTEMDSTIDNVLYGGNNSAFNINIAEGFTEEDIMAVLAEQGLGMDFHNAGYSSNDMELIANDLFSNKRAAERKAV